MSTRLGTTLRTRLSGRVSLRYIGARLLWSIPVMFAVIVVSFMVMRFTPGGPFDREKPLPDNILANLRAQYRLDRPMTPLYSVATKPLEAREQAAFEAEYGVASLGDLRLVYEPAGMVETQLFAYFGQILRGDFGVSNAYNLIHGSDSVENAQKEIDLFFRQDEVVDWL